MKQSINVMVKLNKTGIVFNIPEDLIQEMLLVLSKGTGVTVHTNWDGVSTYEIAGTPHVVMPIDLQNPEILYTNSDERKTILIREKEQLEAKLAKITKTIENTY